MVNNLRFPGQYWDAESGLSYNWHRYYDALIGRYIEADPIGLEGGLNRWGYVGGRPVVVVDPDGRFAMVVAAALAGGAVTGGALFFQKQCMDACVGPEFRAKTPPVSCTDDMGILDWYDKRKRVMAICAQYCTIGTSMILGITGDPIPDAVIGTVSGVTEKMVGD